MAAHHDIDKALIIDEIARRLKAERDALIDTQKRTQSGAFHEENKAEGSKDMRSTEVSYLARGLAERVVQAMEAVAAIGVLKPRPFGPGMRIGATALVTVEDEDTEAQRIYFITTVGGGMKVEIGGQTISVLSHKSPLAQELLGLTQGDDFTFHAPQGARDLLIIAVS